MGNHFMGAIAHANDIILICTTKKKSLNILTAICEVYADEFSITSNARKSIFLVFKGGECVEANSSMYVCD